MIESLYVRNFRKIPEASVTFHEKVNGIFGSNYQGKSTLLIAIAVALAGPSWARGMNLVRRGEDNFEVQLTFRVGGKQYRVMRTKSGAKLHEGDRLLANQQGNVNRAISDIIGVPVESWLSLRFIRQKQAAAMFEAGAAKLNTLVEELTGVRVITIVIDTLGVQSKSLGSKLEGVKQSLTPASQIQETEANLKSLERQKADLHQAQIDLTVRTNQLEKDFERLAARGKRLNEMLAESRRKAELHLQLQRQLAKAEAALAAKLSGKPEGDLEELEAKVTSLKQALAEAEEMDRARAAAQRTFDKAATQAEGAEIRLRETRTKLENAGDLAALQDALADRSEAAKLQEDALETLREEQSSLTSEMNNRAKELASGICSACDRPFEGMSDEHRKASELRLKELTSEILPSLRDKLKEVRTAQDAAEVERSKLSRKIQDVERWQAMVAEDKAEVDAAQARLAAVKAELDGTPQSVADTSKLQEELATVRAQAKAVRDWSDESYRKEVDQLRDSLASADTPDTEEFVKDLETDLEDTQKTFNKVEREIGEAAQQLRHIEEKQNLILKSMHVYRSTLEQAEKNAKAAADLEDEQVKVDGLRRFLRDNRSRYLQQAWTLLLARASAFASANTGEYISEILRTDDGKFQFVEAGELADTSDASGAQAAILGIGVQMALAETLPTRLDVLLADEPTADMDAEHSMSTILGLTTQAKQVVLISHHRMDESVCDEVMEL